MGAHFSGSCCEIWIFLSPSIATFLLGFEDPWPGLLRFVLLSALSAILPEGGAIWRAGNLEVLEKVPSRKIVKKSAKTVFLRRPLSPKHDWAVR